MLESKPEQTVTLTVERSDSSDFQSSKHTKPCVEPFRHVMGSCWVVISSVTLNRTCFRLDSQQFGPTGVEEGDCAVPEDDVGDGDVERDMIEN